MLYSVQPIFLMLETRLIFKPSFTLFFILGVDFLCTKTHTLEDMNVKKLFHGRLKCLYDANSTLCSWKSCTQIPNLGL